MNANIPKKSEEISHSRSKFGLCEVKHLDIWENPDVRIIQFFI